MLKPLKPVQLSPINSDNLHSFKLETRAGRDAVAEQIEKDIDQWCQLQYDDGPRSHLGASIIGHECEAYIWFSFRWMYYKIHTGRMQRLFQRGHLEEYRVIEWLTGIGFEVASVNTVDDNQQFRITFAEGHGGGSSDGISKLPPRYRIDEPVLIEIKTQKDKKFSILQGSGVQKEKPQHFTQASVYGRRLKLRYCLYIAVNKEDDDLDVEMIELDWDLADAHINRAEKIINSQFRPPRISELSTFWQCKFCDAQAVCHLGAPVEKNCRSCRFSEAMPNKEWKCNQWNAIIPPTEIAKGCEAWIPLGTH